MARFWGRRALRNCGRASDSEADFCGARGLTGARKLWAAGACCLDARPTACQTFDSSAAELGAGEMAARQLASVLHDTSSEFGTAKARSPEP